MTRMTASPLDPAGPATAGGSRGRIRDWRPEDDAFWKQAGSRVARRNLLVSIFAEHVGFSVWSMWSVFVLFLVPAYGISPDLKTAAAEKFLLTTLPTALGAGMRLPYALAVARFGGRNWTVVSACVLLVPAISAAVALRPGTSLGTLLLLAALAGAGGGNFASSMANINAFYPQRLKGRALGLNAGGGNVGVAVVQLTGLAVLATAGQGHPRVVLGIYIPLIVLAALAAGLLMDNLADVRNEKRAMRDACREPHTWIISFLYIGTFGSFIGFSFAFGQVLQDQFGAHFRTAGTVDPVKIACLTALGPLVGSLIRPAGGWLADRAGGARTTFWIFAAMAAAAAAVLAASRERSLELFCGGFVTLFALSGAGNGSTCKMIPAIFADRARPGAAAGADPDAAGRESRRMASAVIGIAGAAGAAGGVLVNIAFRQSFLSYGTGDAAYIAFIALYLCCLAVTWTVYLRARGGRPAPLPGSSVPAG
jgi:MFS transporter, NNP family, nitrate/nitrite transporter